MQELFKNFTDGDISLPFTKKRGQDNETTKETISEED